MRIHPQLSFAWFFKDIFFCRTLHLMQLSMATNEFIRHLFVFAYPFTISLVVSVTNSSMAAILLLFFCLFSVNKFVSLVHSIEWHHSDASTMADKAEYQQMHSHRIIMIIFVSFFSLNSLVIIFQFLFWFIWDDWWWHWYLFYCFFTLSFQFFVFCAPPFKKTHKHSQNVPTQINSIARSFT